VSSIEFVFYAALGLAAGITGGLFLHLLLWSRKQFQRLPAKSQWAQPLAAHLHVDHDLDVALDRMGRSGLQMLPVISRLDPRELLGVVYLSDILNAYRVAMQSADPHCGTISGQGPTVK